MLFRFLLESSLEIGLCSLISIFMVSITILTLANFFLFSYLDWKRDVRQRLGSTYHHIGFHKLNCAHSRAFILLEARKIVLKRILRIRVRDEGHGDDQPLESLRRLSSKYQVTALSSCLLSAALRDDPYNNGPSTPLFDPSLPVNFQHDVCDCLLCWLPPLRVTVQQ